MSLSSLLQKYLSLPAFRPILSIVAFFLVVVHIGAALAAQTNLSWNPTTTYTDGTQATTVSGYRLYSGTAPGKYTQNIDLGNVTSHTLSGLGDATTYYFAVTAYDSAGTVSGFSNEASFTTPALPPPPTVYTVSASAGSGGSITPSGSIGVSQGVNQSFTITPNAGYRISGVTVDGTSVGAVSTYNFSNISANHTITAAFTANTSSFSLSASAGTGGSISPAGTSTVTSGGSQTYTITPASGYKIANVTVDGSSVGSVGTYTFNNVTANHTIQATFTPTTTSTVVTTVNSGGTQFTDSAGLVYAADRGFTGGTAARMTAAITGTNDDTLYQSERWGNFSYNVPVANGNYAVTLKFAENTFSAPGQRVFNVAIGGRTVISNLDIYAKVGKNAAYDVVVPANVTNGTLSINFTSQVDYAKVNAIKIVPTTPTTSGEVIFASNNGGPPTSDSTGVTYAADSNFSGGMTGGSAKAISGTVDDTLYQTARYGTNFAYNIPVADGNYSVTLKFSEITWTAPGQRIFNVAMNGQTVISNLDIYAKVGSNAAYDVVVPVTVTGGNLNINFTSQVNYAKISGIVIKRL